jgi:DNA-binding transcriptional ArsR family regulator
MFINISIFNNKNPIGFIVMKESSNLFMALSDPTRREILRLLKVTDRTPTEMLERLSISQPTLSHHLDILKRASLVRGDREGQCIRYSLNMTVFQSAVDYLTQFVKRR